jgi:hypothetical protein
MDQITPTAWVESEQLPSSYHSTFLAIFDCYWTRALTVPRLQLSFATHYGGRVSLLTYQI